MRAALGAAERGLLIAIALVAAHAAAFAEPGRDPIFHPFTVDCGSIPLPPAPYDRSPNMRVVIRRLDFALVDHACRSHGVRAPAFLMDHGTGITALLDRVTGNGFEVQACAFTVGSIGVVILPEVGSGGVTEEWSRCALRHELGHLNGWPQSHPGAQFGRVSSLEEVSLPVASLPLVNFPSARHTRAVHRHRAGAKRRFSRTS